LTTSVPPVPGQNGRRLSKSNESIRSLSMIHEVFLERREGSLLSRVIAETSRNHLRRLRNT
jgi:hypothetical protein